MNDDDNDDIMDDEEEEKKKEKEKKEDDEEVDDEEEEKKKEKEKKEDDGEEEQENDEEQQHKSDNDDTERKEEEEEQIAKNIIDMGKDLHDLLQNINKIPTPPPTNNPQYTTNKYRSLLITHLSKINSVNEFVHCHEIFMPVNSDSSIPIESSNVNKLSFVSSIPSSSSQKSSINFIINEEKHVESSYDTDLMALSDYEIPISNVERGESSEMRECDKSPADWDSVDPSSLVNLPDEELKRRQQEACLFIANKIINIYESTLKDQIKTEILRRCQFNKLILLLEYYEKLEVFCNLHLVRTKGDTVKAQAYKTIVKSSRLSEDQPPRIKGNEITQMVAQGVRIRRLLEISSNNYNIFYAFPDLRPQFFLSKKLNVVNFERWLKLVETGELPSVEEGEQLHNEYKEKAKKIRIENFNFSK